MTGVLRRPNRIGADLLVLAGRIRRRLIYELTTRLGVVPVPEHVTVASNNGIFSIAILRGRSLGELQPVAGVQNPVITCEQVSDANAISVADPFMIRSPEGWHMFFEVLVRDGETGDTGQIGLATSPDGLQWAYCQIVLREPFHLSFPYVFHWQGDYYMVPETHEANAVRLYKAVEFPTRWQLERTLIEGAEFVDACPFFFRGRWWLFTSGGTLPMRADVLRLHCAHTLTGPWTEHPSSPIHTMNPHIARPAGRVLVSGGRVVRFAQECDPNYGTLVRAIEITELTETAYREQPAGVVPILKGSGTGWNAIGMHHIDPHLLDDGQWLACVDGWAWKVPTA